MELANNRLPHELKAIISQRSRLLEKAMQLRRLGQGISARFAKWVVPATLCCACPAVAQEIEAIPATEPAIWILAKDYPRQASLNNVVGNVAFALVVAPDGRPQSCTITKASESDLLNRATCDLLMERARFEPVRNADGEPVFGVYRDDVD